MEEASVAGESPDKSEQQQSSGTTRSERDPRLDVFREPEPPAEPGVAGTGEEPASVEPAGDSDGDARTDAAGAPEATEGAESAPSPAEAPEGAPGGPEAAEGGPEAAEGVSEGASGADEEAGAVEPEAEVSEPEPDAEPEAVAEPEAAEPEADEPEAVAEPEAADDEAEPGTGGPEADDSEPDASESAPEEGDARLRAAVAAWVTKTDDGDSGAADDDADQADSPDEQPRVPRSRDEKPAPEPDGKPEADAEAEAPADDEKQPAAEAQAPVDQPTAVFKAPRLPKVDQPTTALKITRSPSGRPVSAETESLTERTSQFVPLRSDDARPAPAPPKPESPAPAPGAPAALSGAERTRQQPMPPRPPLDLLAELTNTPPPPETPVRTAVRRVKIWTPLVLLLLLVFAIVQMVRPLPDPTLTMTAKSTYGFEGAAPKLPWPDQGQGYMAATGLGKVDSFGEQKPVPIASVAKAMTAYLVLKSHPLKRGEEGPKIRIDAKAEADGKLYTEGESTLSTVKEGDYLTERDALSAIMIPSANNIARLLARWEAGSEKAFVEKMNTTADELGMKNTTYTDPSGLTASTVSTAEDLVKLGEKLVEFPALMDITKLPEWKDPSGHVWRNWNTLVPYDGALGIKTGSTTKAGGNLLFAAHKMIDGTDQLIVGAVLGQYDKNSIIDEVNRVSKKVMLATQDLLEGAKVVKKGDVVGEVDDGMGHTTPVVATKDVKAVGWSGLTVKLELTDDGRTIPHEAVAGTHVGTLTVGEGRSQVKVAVALQSDLAKPSFGDKLTRLG
ncbi:D-alanyl-D-alanine carboxypeptidase [Streptomyces sp. NBC_00727]|uniref:D-alanyl-D-alanine carboxypeptidase n=1 Tax=Streptomyces sp. NBC_00727 TaxID=2903675 RepID=UPI00386E955F